jgi:hypothetical protein
MSSCHSAAQRRLWSPVTLEATTRYNPSHSVAQRRLWSPVALQPSASYGLLSLQSPPPAIPLSLCSPEQAMDFCHSAAQRRLWSPVTLESTARYNHSHSAAQRRLWTPVTLQPSAGYGLLSLCTPAQAMDSCHSAAQRRLWSLVTLQPSAGYGLLSLYSPAQATASSFTTFRDYTMTRHSRQDSCTTSTSQHTKSKNIHAPGGIRTHNRSSRAAVVLRLRLRGHWDRASI